MAICQTKHDQEKLVHFGVIKTQQVSHIPGSGVDTDVYTPLKKREDLGKFVLMSSRMLLDKS